MQVADGHRELAGLALRRLVLPLLGGGGVHGWGTVCSQSGPTALLSRCPTANRSSWALTVKLPGEQGGWEEG